MLASYYIALKNQAGTRLAQFDQFAALSYQRQRNRPGSYQFDLTFRDERAEMFELDGQVEIWRRGDWDGADWEADFEGFHRRWEDRTGRHGEPLLRSWGPGYLDLLVTRFGFFWYYWWPWGLPPIIQDGYFVVTATPPEIIADFVAYEAGPQALYIVAGIVIADRRVPGLTVAAPPVIGNVITEQLRNEQLLDKVRGIAEAYALDIRIVGIGPAEFEFRVAEVGIDRRVDNPDLRAPVLFSLEHGNMETPRYIEDALDEITDVYVGGQGQGAARVMEQIQALDRTGASPWNRREMFIDARDASQVVTLQARGQKILKERGPIFDLSFQIKETEACKYKRDWDLGDLVTAIYGDLQKDYRIESVTIVVNDRGVETLDLGLVEYVAA